MKKYLSLLKYELKTLLKDSLNIFMVFFPFIILFITGVIIPTITKKLDNMETNAIMMLIVLAVALSFGGYIAGAMLGFGIIENKDEKTILNIAVTPIKVEGYTLFKLIYTYILAIVGNLIIIGGLKLFASDAYVIIYQNQTIRLLDNFTWLHVIIFSLVSALFVPTVALVIASFSKNKIEGFTFMKAGGLVILLPILSLLPAFSDAKQYILGIIPNFWPIKAMLNVSMVSTEASNLNYYLYMLIGGVYLLLVSVISFKFFIKKISLN